MPKGDEVPSKTLVTRDFPDAATLTALKPLPPGVIWLNTNGVATLLKEIV